MYGNRYGCMIASFTSVETGERNLRLKGAPLERQRADAERVDERRRLAGPGAVVQLIEREHGALRHARHELLERAPRRLVEVEVEVQQRDDEVRIPLEVLRNRLLRVALDQFDLRNVPERAIAVENRGGARDVVGGIGREAAGDRMRVHRRRRIARTSADEAVEGVEPDHASNVVERLEDRAERGPGHQAAARKHAALDD